MLPQLGLDWPSSSAVPVPVVRPGLDSTRPTRLDSTDGLLNASLRQMDEQCVK